MPISLTQQIIGTRIIPYLPTSCKTQVGSSYIIRSETITEHPAGCQTTLSPPSLRASQTSPLVGVRSCKKYCVLYGILGYFEKIPLIKALKEGEAAFQSTWMPFISGLVPGLYRQNLICPLVLFDSVAYEAFLECGEFSQNNLKCHREHSIFCSFLQFFYTLKRGSLACSKCQRREGSLAPRSVFNNRFTG